MIGCAFVAGSVEENLVELDRVLHQTRVLELELEVVKVQWQLQLRLLGVVVQGCCLGYT